MTQTAITSQIGELLLKAFLTESPRPSQRQLAIRFGLTQSAVQRYLKRHALTLNQANQNTASSDLVVKALPEATERIMAITKDLTVNKMRRVLEEAENQYNALKDTNPALAGAYLKEMRQTLESIGDWSGIKDALTKEQASAEEITEVRVVWDLPPREKVCKVCKRHGTCKVETNLEQKPEMFCSDWDRPPEAEPSSSIDSPDG